MQVALAVATRRWHFQFDNTNNMPFELPSDEATLIPDEQPADPAADARQLALRLPDTPPFAVAPAERRPKLSIQDVQSHILYLNGQLDTLRRQLRDHPADRLAMLLHEMIAERERELDRWLAQEQRWDDRLTAIETAIVERDAFRQRQDDLVRERDEARREAEAAARRLAAAEHAADEARRHAAALARSAERERAEQLRLRHEREIDRTHRQVEERRVAAQRQAKSWFTRLVRG